MELHHVLDKVAHSCPAFCGFWKLDPDVVGPIYSLACAERAFDFVSFPDGLGHLLEIFGLLVSFGGRPSGLQ